MADTSTKTLSVLTTALELRAFTMPELTIASGASYETVKRVLGQGQGGMFERTEKMVRGAMGRPAALWRVGDADAIERRLNQAGAALEAERATTTDGEAAQDDGEAPEDLAAERQLAAAENDLLFGFASEHEEDAVYYARRALEELSRTGIEVQVAPVDGPEFGLRRNLPSAVGRASVVAAVAQYLASGEAESLGGPEWRRAFGAIAAVESADSNALHKRFLVGLVRVADQRAAESEAPIEEFAESLLAEAAEGTLDRAKVSLLLDLVSRDDLEADVAEDLVDAACLLARGGDDEVAAQAAETLAAIGQPRDPAFWVELLANGRTGLTAATLFERLGEGDLRAAFSFLGTALGHLVSPAEARDALRSALPAIYADAGSREQGALEEFLASLPGLIATGHHDQTDLLIVNDIVADARAIIGDEEEFARTRELLAREAMTPETAATAVPALMAVGGETELARRVVAAACRDDEPWDFAARWYLEVCPRADLDDAKRGTLFDAVLTELRAEDLYDGAFVMTLAQRAADEGVELTELLESSELEPETRLAAERTMTFGYAHEEVVADLHAMAAF
jgi:hypothetical protein